MRTQPIPLARRRGDIALLAFFWVNILFITYIVDLETLIIPDPANFRYPRWPPPALVDLIHWWGRTYDPLLLARPVWWKVTIWIDALFFGPFYVVAIYAYWRGREWIRVPSLIYASVLITIVQVILSEEFWGPYRSPRLAIVLLANAPWLLFPIYILVRMVPQPHPFSRPQPSDGQEQGRPAPSLTSLPSTK
jgi:hypothetical protein